MGALWLHAMPLVELGTPGLQLPIPLSCRAASLSPMPNLSVQCSDVGCQSHSWLQVLPNEPVGTEGKWQPMNIQNVEKVRAVQCDTIRNQNCEALRFRSPPVPGCWPGMGAAVHPSATVHPTAWCGCPRGVCSPSAWHHWAVGPFSPGCTRCPRWGRARCPRCLPGYGNVLWAHAVWTGIESIKQHFVQLPFLWAGGIWK